ncbi:hypothetical protein CRM79_02695 [Pantoea agglomerans]|nr:hypothetical protein CRM79_02695 [Pantoea agglomerans]
MHFNIRPAHYRGLFYVLATVSQQSFARGCSDRIAVTAKVRPTFSGTVFSLKSPVIFMEVREQISRIDR